MRNMRCLECDWTGPVEKLTKDGRCPRCKSDKVIISPKARRK